MKSILRKFKDMIKQNRTIYSLHTRLFDKDYIAQRKRMRSTKAKHECQIEREMKMYSDYWGMPANEYVRYGLFEKQLSDEKILDYIPSQFFYCSYLNKAYDKVDVSANDDKLRQYYTLRQHNIPTPVIHYVIIDGRLKNLGNKFVDFAELSMVIPDEGKLFIKPTDGCGGNGIIVIIKRNGALCWRDRVITRLDDLPINKSRVYIIQKGLIQNVALSRINETSLNTLRTIVHYEKGMAKVICCILRMGRKGAEVDNSAQGGISVMISFDDGRFCPPAVSEHGGGIFYVHPDSGFDFRGNRIPEWEVIKSSIIETVGKLAEYPVVGWDIAITNTGISVIEFNLGYGIVHAQLCCGGLRRAIGAYPDMV